MWSETIGFIGQDRSETKKKSVLVLVLQVWCCFVKHDLVTLVVIIFEFRIACAFWTAVFHRLFVS